MKKIAVIGTHGIRKTTLCYKIAAILKVSGRNADVLQEVARKSPFPVNEGTTQEAQRWILHTQIASEIAAEVQRANYLLCDRSVLDNYAYFVRAFGRDSFLDNLVREHVKTYAQIIYVPLLKTSVIEPDGFRSTNSEFQKAIDDEVQRLLSAFDVRHIRFSTVEELVPLIN